MSGLHSSRTHRLSLRLTLLLGWLLIASAILLHSSAPVVQASPDAEACGPIASDTNWIAASSPYTVTCDV
jgi:hypothetical protein